MKSCIFQIVSFIYIISLAYLHWTLLAFRKPESRSSITTYTKNEWLNHNKYVVAMEKEEGDENNIKEFIKLMEQCE